MLTERELCGLDAYLRMRVLGETIKITAANLADVGALWWARKIETPPFNSCPVGSEEFRATVGGQIPRETLHGLAERAGISFLDATRLSLLDLVLMAAGGRAAGAATAAGQGASDPVEPPPQPPDGDGYVPISRLWGERFPGKRYRTDTAVAFLDEHGIRYRRPRKNRLEAHAADWERYWLKQARLAFESDGGQERKSITGDTAETPIFLENAAHMYKKILPTKQRRQ